MTSCFKLDLLVIAAIAIGIVYIIGMNNVINNDQGSRIMTNYLNHVRHYIQDKRDFDLYIITQYSNSNVSIYNLPFETRPNLFVYNETLNVDQQLLEQEFNKLEENGDIVISLFHKSHKTIKRTDALISIINHLIYIESNYLYFENITRALQIVIFGELSNRYNADINQSRYILINLFKNGAMCTIYMHYRYVHDDIVEYKSLFYKYEIIPHDISVVNIV